MVYEQPSILYWRLSDFLSRIRHWINIYENWNLDKYFKISINFYDITKKKLSKLTLLLQNGYINFYTSLGNFCIEDSLLNILIFCKVRWFQKDFLVSSDSSKKRTNKFVFSTIKPKKPSKFIRFLEESEDTKNRFEIIWPLVINLYFLCQNKYFLGTPRMI